MYEPFSPALLKEYVMDPIVVLVVASDTADGGRVPVYGFVYMDADSVTEIELVAVRPSPLVAVTVTVYKAPRLAPTTESVDPAIDAFPFGLLVTVYVTPVPLASVKYESSA